MIRPQFALGPTETFLLSSAAFLVLLLAGGIAWWIFGVGPRRRRTFRKAQTLLREGAWEQALSLVEPMVQESLSPAWQGRVRNLRGEAHHTAGKTALSNKAYEEAARHFHSACVDLPLDENALRGQVLDALLNHATSLFADGPVQNEKTRELFDRARVLDPGQPAPHFWLGLCHLRDQRLDLASEALVLAHELGQKKYLDPPLYLGMIFLRQGKPEESLRYFSEANRIDATSPFVSLHVGLALVASLRDPALATRALLRALGPRGFLPFARTPHLAWVEGMPETRSFVRRLASRFSYPCPLIGSELTSLIAQGRFALGQAYLRQGLNQEAAEILELVLKESAPTPPVLRAHGLALARLERYDQAYKQLRIALDQAPQDRLAAGYLALCGALGKPTNPDDKARNVSWAIRQLAQQDPGREPEWPGLICRVLAEARTHAISVEPNDLQRLCDVLVGAFLTTREAAEAYAQLAEASLELLRPEHAWVYCQAVVEQGGEHPRSLELFNLTFRTRSEAETFFRQRGWDWAEAEYTYLCQWAKAHPGSFPEIMGPEYPPQASLRLLERVQATESSNPEAAQRAAETLLCLAPTDTRAHAVLARLLHHAGHADKAISLLAGWHRLEPTQALPLVQRAVLETERGQHTARSEAIRQALEVSRGAQRGAVALLGARLALRANRTEAEALVEICLAETPDDVEGLLLRAALRAVANDHTFLAQMAPRMRRPEVPDPRFHFMAAVCFMAAREPREVLEACRRAWSEPTLTVECRFLMGWASLLLEDEAAAVREWEIVARTPNGPSSAQAQALLGRLRFRQGDLEGALPWWNGVPAQQRSTWGLEETLRTTTLLAGLAALDGGRYECAAERFRDAGKLGLRDRRLGPLVCLALVQAGRQRLFPDLEESLDPQ